MMTDRIAGEYSSPPPPVPSAPDLATVRATAIDFEQQARTMIRERPVVAVLSAVGLGYLVARLVSRGPR